MEYGKGKIVGFFQKYPVVAVIFLGLQIFFIISLGLTLASLGQSNEIIAQDDSREVIIEDLSNQLVGATNEVVSDIQHRLAEAVLYNMSNVNLSNAKAMIRDGTLTRREFTNRNVVALSFVVDIPALEQSYQVYYNAPSNFRSDLPAYRNPSAVLCLDKYVEKKYPEFKCESSYPSDTRQRIVADYLRLLDLEKIALEVNGESLNLVNIVVYDVDTDEVTKESYVGVAKEVVTSLGVNAALFEYEILPQ